MQRERDHLKFGIRAPHSVAVDHRNSRHRADHERDGGIETAGLRAQNRADLLAKEPLELAERGQNLVDPRDLFTVGAPIIAQGTTRASSSTSATSIMRTVPYLRIACWAMSLPI
jgi:hypothetical protein